MGSQLGLGYLLCFLCALVSFLLSWGACLGVADGGVGYIHSLAGLKLGVKMSTKNVRRCIPNFFQWK